MNIHKATDSYEAWLRKQTRVIDADFEYKHEQMSAGVFPFFRATFYRWLQIWPDQCKYESEAPHFLVVGDLHIENFGTSRNAEGRLIWGVNDFDEASNIPYTIDLIRLATSALLSCEMADVSALSPTAACDAILAGYADAIAVGGRPFVLSEKHPTLTALAHGELRNPVNFWQKMREQPALKMVPPDARRALESMLPKPRPAYHVIHQRKGLGSLGRWRYTAVAEHNGGMIAREAKALLPSACAWMKASPKKKPPIHYQQIVESAVRCPDPFLSVNHPWLIRRLAPDCSRIELSSLSRATDETRLLRAMGWETANIHLGNAGAAKAIKKDLRSRPTDWLHVAARRMVKAVTEDWMDWKKRN